MNDVRYLTYKIGDVFTLRRGERQTKASRENGDIPYYSATQDNNGLTDFILNPTFIDKNKIVVSTFCQAYWAQNEFTASDEMTLLYNEHLNKYNALYICRIIENNKHMYGFNRKAFSYRLREQRIMLPVNLENEPDWEYMKQYIKEKEKESKAKAETFLLNELRKIGDYEDVDYTDIYDWGKYKINDIADVYSGNDWTYKDRISGDVPFIGASSTNNSITDYINPEMKPKYVQKNAISINRNGSIGYSFYHPYLAYFSGDTRFIKLKNNIDSNEYISLFITTTIEKQRHKYMYGYKTGTARIKNQYVMLPVQEDDKPDYEFMDNYMRKMKYERIQRLLKFLSENHNI